MESGSRPVSNRVYQTTLTPQRSATSSAPQARNPATATRDESESPRAGFERVARRETSANRENDRSSVHARNDVMKSPAPGMGAGLSCHSTVMLDPTGTRTISKRSSPGNTRAYRRAVGTALPPFGRTGCMSSETSHARRRLRELRRRRVLHRSSLHRHRHRRPYRVALSAPYDTRGSDSVCSGSLCSRRTAARRN